MHVLLLLFFYLQKQKLLIMLFRVGPSPGWEGLMEAVWLTWITLPCLQGALTLNSRSSPDAACLGLPAFPSAGLAPP